MNPDHGDEKRDLSQEVLFHSFKGLIRDAGSKDPYAIIAFMPVAVGMGRIGCDLGLL